MTKELYTHKLSELTHAKQWAAIGDAPQLGLLPYTQHEVVDKALSMGFPSAPDEAFRRFKFQKKDGGQIEYRDLTVTKAEITAQGEGLALLDIQRGDSAEYQPIRKLAADIEACDLKDRPRANDIFNHGLLYASEAFAENIAYAVLNDDIENTLVIKGGSGTDTISFPVVVIEQLPGTRGQLHIDISGTVIPRVVIRVGEGAELVVSRSVNGTESAVVYMEDVIVEDNARYESIVFDGVGASRLFQLRHNLAGRGSKAELKGLSSAVNTDHSAIKLRVNHLDADTLSDSFVKTVARDNAHCVFIGNVKIPQGSPRSEGHENHRSLLMSDDARIVSLPELEIVENDVKCSHGSTVASLSTEDIFFLRSRGLDKEQAEKVLVESFYREILQDVRISADLMKRLYDDFGLVSDNDLTAAEV